MDRYRLIAEVKKRPELWDVNCAVYKPRVRVPALWKEIAASMGPNVTVDECKRKWKNLRDGYRAEVNRIELRIARDMLEGTYDPSSNKYKSKWPNYEDMHFIKDIKRPRPKENSNASPHDNDESNNDEFEDDCSSEIHDIKAEMEEFTEISTAEDDDALNRIPAFRDLDQMKVDSENVFNTEIKEMEPSSQQSTSQSCHSNLSKRCNNRLQFLQVLEQEEQNLMQATRLDTNRSNEMVNVGDSDYNFLVSFLPQMKRMNVLQNLEFRAKISQLIFNITVQSTTNNATTATSSCTAK